MFETSDCFGSPDDLQPVSTGKQTESELRDRFECDIAAFSEVAEKLTAQRIAEAVDVLDLDPEVFSYISNTPSDPTEHSYSLGYSVLKQMGYDITFATPALYNDMIPIGRDYVKVMAIRNQLPAIKRLGNNFLPFDSADNILPAQALVFDVLDGDLVYRSSKEETIRVIREAYGDDFLNRAMLTSEIIKQNKYRSSEALANFYSPTRYLEIVSANPDLTPLGIEELAGMLAGLTHDYLRIHPELHPKNLSSK